MRWCGGVGAALAGIGVTAVGLTLFSAGQPPVVGFHSALAAVQQDGPATAAGIADPGDVTVGSTVTLAADVSPGAPTYTWDFGDRSASGRGAVVQHTFPLVDDYTVKLTIQDAAGTITSTSRTVRVVPKVESMVGEPVLGQIVPASSFPANLLLDASGPATISVKIGGAYLFSDRFDYNGGPGETIFEVPDIRVVDEDDPNIGAELIQKPGASIPLQNNVRVTVSYPVSSGNTETANYTLSLQRPAAVASSAAATAAPSPTPSTEPTDVPVAAPTPAPGDAGARYLQARPAASGTPGTAAQPSPASSPAVATVQPSPVAPAEPPFWQITYPSYLPVVGYPVNADDVDGYYVKGDPQFHAVSDPLLRRYAIKIARAGGVFPNDPQRTADNIYRYVYGLLGIGDPGELQTDLTLLGRVLSGALVSGSRTGEYICIAHAYFVSSLTRTLGLPTREETIGFGRGVSQNSTGAWNMNYYQEGANEVWYAGAWHHYDTWIGTRNRDDYLDTSLTEIAWYAFSEQRTSFLDINGGPVGLSGHDFSLGKYVGTPGTPDQWRFLEQHTRPGIRIADPGPEAYASADRAAPAPPDELVSAGILNPPSVQEPGR